MNRLRELSAEFIGSAFLTAIVIGSGIAAQQLSSNQIGLELLENTAATVAGLYILINVFGPISGAHFNPIVSFADVVLGKNTLNRALAYLPAQVAGCALGALTANAMFALPLFQLSTHHRATTPHLLSETIATAGLLLVIFALSKNGGEQKIAGSVASYIGAAYFFTSSTSFANPAISVGRMLSNSFAGIAPSSVPAFVLAQIIGGLLAVLFVKFLFPEESISA